jgi:hypothetical protein
MSFFVVDTNVPVVANGRSEQADPDCVITCIDALAEIRERGIVILDDMLLILQEYMGNLSMSGQPGPGDIFMKWIWSVQADERHCRQVHITPLENDPGNFVEFPKDARLMAFDRNDRKFVAAALSSGNAPELLNAVDADWAEHFVALSEASLQIKFLCPQHVCVRK